MIYIRTLMAAGIVAACFLGACMFGQDPASVGDGESSAQIRSVEELDTYLATTRHSPLDQLSPETRQRFIDSLVFTPGGLGSYRHSDLAGLSATEVFQILSLFGVQRTTALVSGAKVATDKDRMIMNGQRPSPYDHYSYKCDGPSTCVSAVNYICLSTCSAP